MARWMLMLVLAPTAVSAASSALHLRSKLHHVSYRHVYARQRVQDARFAMGMGGKPSCELVPVLTHPRPVWRETGPLEVVKRPCC
jgi:hypothetical protein